MNLIEEKIIAYVRKQLQKEETKWQNGAKNKMFAWEDALNDLLSHYAQKTKEDNEPFDMEAYNEEKEKYKERSYRLGIKI